MRKKTVAKVNNALIYLGVSVGIILSIVAGRYLSPLMGALLFELAFNFYLAPKLIKDYYRLNQVEEPGIVTRFMPFYNLTQIISPILAWSSIIVLGIIVLDFVAMFGLRYVTFISESQLFHLLDVLPSIAFISSLLYYALVGIGLAGLSFMVDREFKNYYADQELEEELTWFPKVMRALVSSSTIVTTILFIIPVFRIAPMIYTVNRVVDLYEGGKRL